MKIGGDATEVKNPSLISQDTILYSLGIIGICFCLFSVTKCTATPEMTQALETCNPTISIRVEDAKNVSKFTLDGTDRLIEARIECVKEVTKVFTKPTPNALMVK